MSKDSELQQGVMAELNWEPSVIAAHIDITANGGVITFSGHVNGYRGKHAAETSARPVGVKAVAKEIGSPSQTTSHMRCITNGFSTRTNSLSPQRVVECG